MAITIKLFASLRERAGWGEQIVAADLATVADAQAWLAQHIALAPNTLCAVNQQYARPESPVKDGDEVAFFPPVTGG